VVDKEIPVVQTETGIETDIEKLNGIIRFITEEPNRALFLNYSLIDQLD
jgi:hypothetical protein